MSIPRAYYAVLKAEPESGTVGVRFPDHSGVITYGGDWEEAEQMAGEALGAALEAEFDRELDLPPAKKVKAKRGERLVLVRLDPRIWMAFVLRDWRKRAGFTQKEMAKRLDISYQAYQRMERPGRSNLTVETLEKIALSLHGELIIDLKLPTIRSA
jgi:predicted RNase H-like HicB family nuclease/DNA-binding XRE family transcriptional regulator